MSVTTLDHRIWLYERVVRVASQVRDEAAASESNGRTMANDEGQDT